MTLDPAVAALLGSCVGGVIAIIVAIIGIIVNFISNRATAQRELKSFRRTQSKQYIDHIRSTYEFALNVFFNLARGGSPDRTTYGNMFARISLYGSPEVKAILDAYLKSSDKEQIDIQSLTAAMKTHLEEPERSLK